MNKKVIVINGQGGVGKDTLVDLASCRFRILNISSITPIKELAAISGWDGRKDDKSRKFLSDLKHLCIEYNDYPTMWAKARYEEFLLSDNEIMFLHIREPEEIEKFVKTTDGKAVTLLVRGGDRISKSHYGNASDDGVENYHYDYYFLNDKTIEEGKEDFCRLLEEILRSN